MLASFCMRSILPENRYGSNAPHSFEDNGAEGSKGCYTIVKVKPWPQIK